MQKCEKDFFHALDFVGTKIEQNLQIQHLLINFAGSNNKQTQSTMTDNEFINEIFEQAESAEVQQMAEDIIARVKSGKITPDKLVLDLKKEDIMKVLKVSYIAERFFGRSRSWLCHKLNNDIVNGKREGFTPEEREKLKQALDTIAYEIQILADNL